MKKEDIEILVKDLCARLPYNTMIHGVYAYENPDYDCGREPDKILHSENDSVLTASDIEWIEMGAAEVKPYLFPMSSMTDGQREEFIKCSFYERREEDCGRHTEVCYYDMVGNEDELYPNYDSIDWLNAHHFDYRGLIERDLAIDATNLNIY